jgi:hypothetical protein
MAVPAAAPRELIELDIGHLPLTSFEALTLFSEIVRCIGARPARGARARDPRPPRAPRASARPSGVASPRARSLTAAPTGRTYLLGGATQKVGYDVLNASEEYLAFLDREAELLDLRPEHRLADMGCGTGNFAARLLAAAATRARPRSAPASPSSTSSPGPRRSPSASSHALADERDVILPDVTARRARQPRHLPVRTLRSLRRRRAVRLRRPQGHRPRPQRLLDRHLARPRRLAPPRHRPRPRARQARPRLHPRQLPRRRAGGHPRHQPPQPLAARPLARRGPHPRRPPRPRRPRRAPLRLDLASAPRPSRAATPSSASPSPTPASTASTARLVLSYLEQPPRAAARVPPRPRPRRPHRRLLDAARHRHEPDLPAPAPTHRDRPEPPSRPAWTAPFAAEMRASSATPPSCSCSPRRASSPSSPARSCAPSPSAPAFAASRATSLRRARRRPTSPSDIR